MKHCIICGAAEYELELLPTDGGQYICSCCAAWGVDIPENDDWSELAETEIFEDEEDN